MLIKSFVLYRDNCMLQIFRNLVDGYRKTVRVRSCQFSNLIAVVIIKKRCAQRHDVYVIYIWRIVDDSL